MHACFMFTNGKNNVFQGSFFQHNSWCILCFKCRFSLQLKSLFCSFQQLKCLGFLQFMFEIFCVIVCWKLGLFSWVSFVRLENISFQRNPSSLHFFLRLCDCVDLFKSIPMWKFLFRHFVSESLNIYQLLKLTQDFCCFWV